MNYQTKLAAAANDYQLGVEVAKRLKAAIREATGLTASAGVAPNKFLAKIASGWKKPDGLTVIRPEHGADVVRWYMMSNSPPWDNMKFALRGLMETRNKLFSTLENVYRFLASYANIDGFDPAAFLDEPGDLDHADLSRARGWRPVSERSELDRWMLSELNSVAASMTAKLDAYDHHVSLTQRLDMRG